MPTESPVARAFTRFAYGASQLPRVAWYVAHGLVLRRLSERARAEDGETARPSARTEAPVPARGRLYADMGRLFLQDLANVEAGIYPLPADRDGSPLALLRRSRLFFDDLPEIHRRREEGGHDEVLHERADARRPRYYLQNFHFQSGGWLTDDSAKRYDTQVEVLFSGAANAMRRQALPALHEIFFGRDQRQLRLLDVGSGTGRFLDFVKQAWPRLAVTGVDLSEPYLRYAKDHLRGRARLGLVVANGEALPVADASQDAITSVFLFHELPPKVRAIVMRECARALKPGGRLVIVDSLQRGDRPDYEGLLDLFPQNYHEPYYASYASEDFSALAAKCGLVHARSAPAFVSKVMVFDKPRAS